MKLWQKKYKLNEEIEKFTVGDDYLLDQKLVKYDCLASIAHAKMLGKIGVLKIQEVEKLIKNLEEIIKLDNKGKFVISPKDEDCHTAIENYLVKKIGNVGKKIHTARSRNDQVLVALRLYYKNEIKNIGRLADNFVKTLHLLNKKYGNIEMPGYTHMRKAMPSSVKMWTESFIDSMKDNKELLLAVEKLIDQSPLGTGAGYGLPLTIDRKFTAKLLGFKKVQNNSIYVQNSRGKFESSILHALNQIMFDLNKIATDLVMFSMPEFGYFELPSQFCTGSSIMPQKKNPDVLELMRAKYHKTLAYEFAIKNLIGSLISGYNRDLQLTKEFVIKGFEETENCLKIITLVFSKLKINEQNCKVAMTEELYATKKVYELVKKGISFRNAYKKISKEFEK
ncbi:MAG: argininosuccinate lyase [bacterium]